MIGIEAIRITPEIMSRIGEIDEFKGLWAGLERYSTGLQALSDVAEHGENFRKVFGPLQEQTITLEMIGLIHAMQVRDKSSSFIRTGETQLSFMKDGVLIGALDVAAPEDIEPLLQKLIGWLNEALEREDFHPLLSAAIFTAVFLQLSPYQEGNLRVARFLVLLIMLKSGYAYAPYVPLDKIMNARAEEVYGALAHNQESLEAGALDWSVWLTCFFGVLQGQAETLRDRLAHKEEEISNMPTLSARILALFEEHKRLQMKQIITLTRGRRATLKLRLGELVDGGYLKRHGKARATWYALV